MTNKARKSFRCLTELCLSTLPFGYHPQTNHSSVHSTRSTCHAHWPCLTPRLGGQCSPLYPLLFHGCQPQGLVSILVILQYHNLLYSFCLFLFACLVWSSGTGTHALLCALDKHSTIQLHPSPTQVHFLSPTHKFSPSFALRPLSDVKPYCPSKSMFTQSLMEHSWWLLASTECPGLVSPTTKPCCWPSRREASAGMEVQGPTLQIFISPFACKQRMAVGSGFRSRQDLLGREDKGCFLPGNKWIRKTEGNRELWKGLCERE